MFMKENLTLYFSNSVKKHKVIANKYKRLLIKNDIKFLRKIYSKRDTSIKVTISNFL